MPPPGLPIASTKFDYPPTTPQPATRNQNNPQPEIPTTNNILANTYNVFPMPVESPIHGNRALITDPADPVASPYGWHDTDGVPGAEYTITRGNNVHAYQDIFNLNQSVGGEPDGGPNLDFDFPLDLTERFALHPSRSGSGQPFLLEQYRSRCILPIRL